MIGLIFFLLFIPTTQAGEDPASLALVEQSRSAISSQLQLLAVDLLDELAYEWSKSPPFGRATPTIFMGISIPVGTTPQLGAYLENHFIRLITTHANTNIRLVHCETCNMVIFRSHANHTVVGRGLDQEMAPDSKENYALFLDFEAEGPSLVLRAKLTKAAPPREIVYAKTWTTSSGNPPLLRDSQRLISAEQARQEYLGILHSRPLFQFPLHSSIKIFPGQKASSSDLMDSPPATIPPMLWFEGGVTGYITRDRVWYASLLVGASSIPKAYDAYSVGGQMGRLLSSHVRSLVEPDIYLVLGASFFEITGDVAQSFQDNKRLTAAEIIEKSKGNKSTPKASIPVLMVGFDVQLKNVFMFGTHVENIPSLDKSENLQKDYGFIHNYVIQFGVNL